MNPDHANAATVAVLGIGNMGLPIAKRLCAAGFRVHAWNRSRAKAEALTPFGAQVFNTASEAVANADYCLSLLEDGKAVAQVLFEHGVAKALPQGSLFIDMASILPAEAKSHALQLESLGLAAIDAPVSGGTLGAEAGTLAIMAGGHAADVERALIVLQHLGKTTHVGPSGSGQLAKLANQLIVGISIGAVAEALLLCERGGADVAKVRQAMLGGFAHSRVLEVHGERMIAQDFAARARLAIQLKDMRNVQTTAEELALDLPVTDRVTALYTDAVQHGLAELDQAALFVELAQRHMR